MSDLYGSETERINALINSNKQIQLDNLGSLLSEEQQTNLAGWKEKADEYAHKYTALAEGGGAEIAGALGMEGGYKAVKKLKGLYDKVQARKSAIEQKRQQDAENSLPEESNLNDDPEGFPTAEEARTDAGDLRQNLADRFGRKADQTDIDRITEAEDSPPDILDDPVFETPEARAELFGETGFKSEAERIRDEAQKNIDRSKAEQEDALASGEDAGGGKANLLSPEEAEFQAKREAFENATPEERLRIAEGNRGAEAEFDEVSRADPTPNVLGSRGAEAEFDAVSRPPEGGGAVGEADFDAFSAPVRQTLTAEQMNPKDPFPDTNLRSSEQVEREAPEAVEDEPGASFFSTYSSEADPSTLLSRTVASQNLGESTIRTNRFPNVDSLKGREFAPEEGGGDISSQVVVSNDPAINPFARNIDPEPSYNLPEPGGSAELTEFSGGGNLGFPGEQDVKPPPRQPAQPTERADIPDPPSAEEIQQAGQQTIDSAEQAGSQALQAGRDAVSQAQGTATDLVSGATQKVAEGKSFLQGQLENLQSRGKSIRQGFQNVKDFINKTPSELEDVGQQAGEIAGKTVAKTAGEVAGETTGELTGMATTDAVLGAVPVLGEVALGITGLVSIGEGLYHLFHHKDTPPPAPTLPQVHLATSNPSAGLTQKFASSLPSLDSSAEPGASSMSF